jgi:hypothetical protein
MTDVPSGMFTPPAKLPATNGIRNLKKKESISISRLPVQKARECFRLIETTLVTHGYRSVPLA